VSRWLKTRTGSAVRDGGFSLTELMVTMFIMGIVVAATVSLTIGFQRTNAQNISRQDQIDSARTAVEAMSKSLRTAVKPAQLTSNCTLCVEDAFLQGTDYSVQFYANLNNPNNSIGPSRVTYTLVTTGPTAGQIIETIQSPDPDPDGSGPIPWPGPTGYAYCNATSGTATAACKARLSTRPVAFGALATTGTPMLKYYDGMGVRMSPLISGGSLSGPQLALVMSVEIVVTVQSTDATKPHPTTYVQRVTMPNAQAVIREQSEG
jgi:prepilin-type N-terminal cleavage/methylation domain-containing protein